MNYIIVLKIILVDSSHRCVVGAWRKKIEGVSLYDDEVDECKSCRKARICESVAAEPHPAGRWQLPFAFVQLRARQI